MADTRIKVIQQAQTPTTLYAPKKSKPTIGGTLKNTATQIGKGVLTFGENVFDTALQIGTSKYNPFNPYKGEELKKIQQTAQNIIADNSTQELLNKVGYDKVRPSGMTYQQELDAKSALKSTGLGGQIAQTIGTQLPNIVLGNLGKGTAAKTAASILPTTVTSFGSGVEQAYREGANRQQASLYGGLNAAVETATEYITGGVPGVETGFLSGIDKVAAGGIGKVSNAVTRALLDSGYKIVGEGFEEALAQIMNPLIKNASYSKGEKVNWKDVINSAVQGAIVGGLLNAPSSVSNVKGGIQEQTAIKQQNKPITQTIAPTSTITPTTQQTSQGVVQIQPQGQVEQIFKKIENDRQGLKINYNPNIGENGVYTKNADGTRNITINPNSPKAIEFVLVHELSHDLANTPEYNTLKQTILDYDKGIAGFQEARANLTSMYKDVYTKQILQNNPNITQQDLDIELNKMIDEEATNDVLGTMLSDQTYINKLSTQQPNVFQKIYRWINDMLKRISGKESKFLQDVKLKFENAYRQQNVSQVGVKSSVNEINQKLIQDNKGKTLTKEQQEFFKDSKVVDDNGNLLVMYHGTPTGDFTSFRDGGYFTPNKEYADQYQNPEASSISYGKKTTNPKTYEVYLDIKNPFDIKNKNVLDIYYNEYIKGGNSNFYDPYTSKKEIENLDGIDWLEAEYLKEWIQENHPEFDGMVLDEGGTGGFGVEYKSRGMSYLPFNSNQIKNVDNTKPTLNEDIRFSKTDQGKWQERLNKTYEPVGLQNKKQTFKPMPTMAEIKQPTITPQVTTQPKLNNEIIYKDNIEIIKNPTDVQYEQMKDEAKKQYEEKYYSKPNSDEPMIRTTYDNKGNQYIWKADEAVHPTIESYLKSKDDTLKLHQSQIMVYDKNKIQPTTQPTITPQVTTQETQPETKQRGVYSTALQNQNIPAEIKSGIKNMDQNYIVITDEDALSKAQQKLTDNGADKSLELFKNKFDNNEKLSKYDIAEATLLYNDAFAKGDTQKALDILTSIAVAGTESGQVSQATSILQRATPDGRLLALQKQINKINQERNIDVQLNEEDANKIKNSTNQENLDNAVNTAIENISKQIPKNFKEVLKEWRYLAMLGNPKTHIRNVFSNVAMKGTGKTKNLLSATLQDIFLDESQKTRTLKKSSQEVIDFAKQDAETQKTRIKGTDKYDMGKGKIKPAQSKLSAFNSNALEFEDWLFSSTAYSQSLANYITSKNIDINTITPKQLEEARQYAVDQAQELTFRKASKIADAISQFEKKNIATEILVSSTLPFKTTPINIAKTGVEYSPVGLIKTITKNTYDLKQGKISPSQYIDNLSKGLTGTGISLMGYLLAEMGLLTASGSDEDKEKYFQQMQGKQPYSIKIGNTTITLDWLSPSAMPFFMGAEISEMKKNGTSDDKLLNIASGLATIVDPLTEMSMLQGLNKSLKSYKDNALGGVLVNTLENYALQYIPTISGQVARTLTPDRKSTTGGGTGITKEFNTFLNKAKAKIPVLANTLEPYTDQFGNKEITKNIALRAFQNFLSPSYIKGVKTDKVYEEIQKLYDRTGETSILPTSSSRYFTKDGQKVYLTPEEYTKFNQIDGKKSFEDLSYLFDSQTYKQMNDEERVKAIESFYRASQALAKERYNK